MAEMRTGSLRISCAFAVSNGGKPHAMGAGAHVARKIEFLSTESPGSRDRARGFSVGNSLFDSGGGG
jgi:hypothetical protein